VRYVVVFSDQAEADRDRLNLRFTGRDPLYAASWDAGLMAALDNLTGFPGPLSWAVDEQTSVVFGREVRRLLYYGPTRRRTGTPVRVLFTVLPPDPSSPEDESVIFLLRLLHGSQPLLPDEPAPED
jgi:hypothetical protein